MSEAIKRARIEYLQSIYRTKDEEASRYRAKLEQISRESDDPYARRLALSALSSQQGNAPHD